MFNDDFSFAPSRSDSCGSLTSSPTSSTSPCSRPASRAVSPCSLVSALPKPQPSVADLASQFADSRLRSESRIRYDSCDAYANLDDDEAGWLIADSPTSDYKSSASSSARPSISSTSRPSSHRSARQSSARLLCSSAHRHDIAALVTRMVQAQDQCAVACAAELHPSELALTADDEGYDSSEMDGGSSTYSQHASLAMSRRGLEYRRSSDMRCGTACVSKTTRFRKDRDHSRRRMAEK